MKACSTWSRTVHIAYSYSQNDVRIGTQSVTAHDEIGIYSVSDSQSVKHQMQLLC